MSSTQIGDSSLIWGVGKEVETYGYFESLEYNDTVEVEEATDADGNIVHATKHGNKQAVSGSYIYRDKTGTGSQSPDTLVTTGTTLSLNLTGHDAKSPFNTGEGSGEIYITSASTKYAKGSFKVVDFEGMIWPDLVPAS
jgi:uncharacterized glyoxalase superfamily protein PhnB